MSTKKLLTPDELFFYENAGYSYDPKKQTAEEGRIECAKLLAAAERHAKRSRIYYEWRVDPHSDSREFSDEKPHWSLYCCLAYRGDDVVGSLGGIDFGRGKRPTNDPYKRVVEAELAIEHYNESLESEDAACRDIITV